MFWTGDSCYTGTMALLHKNIHKDKGICMSEFRYRKRKFDTGNPSEVKFLELQQDNKLRVRGYLNYLLTQLKAMESCSDEELDKLLH